MKDNETYETKQAGGDVASAFDEFMRAFEEYKETNERRLGEIERRSADVVTTDKLDRIDRALDKLTLKASRPPIGGGAARPTTSLQHKGAFEGYVRKGDTNALRALEGKSLSVGSDPDGGYLVPEETETTINRALRDGVVKIPLSPVASLTQVRVRNAAGAMEPVGAGNYVAVLVGRPQRIVRTNGAWPIPAVPAAGIEIEFTAGFGSAAADVPAPIRQALLLLIAHWYEHRDPFEIGAPQTSIPSAVSRLLNPYRPVRV